MQEREVQAVSTWIVEAGLAGLSETELVHGFCLRCRDAGLELSRGLALVDTLHPVYEGRAFAWRDDGTDWTPVTEYGRTDTGDAAETWRRSIFYRLLTTNAPDLRCHLAENQHHDFPQMMEFRDQGYTDCLSVINRLAGESVIGQMDCVYSHWITRRPGGFRDADLAALRRLAPVLALALKGVSLARVAGTLVEVYLGRDAGRRVLSGRISRGVAEKIDAVLWFSDLRGFTTIADTARPDEVIPLLDDYADAVISAIEEAGGDVLKLIGDGILAIFDAHDQSAACAAALKAHADMRARVEALNARRSAEERPVTSVYLGLHIGAVFYGNIGSDTRLDFTVVGPAVNEVSRIGALCRSADRGVLLSSAFRAAAPPEKQAQIVSVGRYALRGVARAQELFTLDETA